MKENEEILLPHGCKEQLAREMGVTRATVRLYLRGYYPKSSPSWIKQQQCRDKARRMVVKRAKARK